MCEIISKSKKRKVAAYKVVVERNGRKYSPATGIRYHDGKPIKAPKKVSRIIDYFDPKLINPRHIAFQRLVIGKTSAFLTEVGALKLFTTLVHQSNWRDKGVEISIYVVVLRGGILHGHFMGNCIVAGRTIEFIGKVKSTS
jgi:hypothetical protein